MIGIILVPTKMLGELYFDKTAGEGVWLGGRDSNPDRRIQILSRCATAGMRHKDTAKIMVSLDVLKRVGLS